MSFVFLRKFKIRILVIWVLTAALFNAGCKRNEIDLNKYNSNISPLIISPIGKLQLTVSDLIKSDSLITYDSSGLIRFWLLEDSVFGNKPTDIFDEFTVKELSSSYKFNDFVIPGVNFNETITLREMLGGISDSEKQKIEPFDGTIEVFPSLVLFSSDRKGIFNNVDFKYLDFTKGSLKMTFANNLPTTLNNVLINVFDTSLSGNEVFVGSFEFPEILPFTSEISEIDLKGKRLTDKLSYVLVNIETTQSPVPVLINLNDNIEVDVKMLGASVYSGLAKLPRISLPNQLTRIDLSSNFPNVELKEIGLLSSKFQVKMESTINSTVNVDLVFPDITIGGQPLDGIKLDNVSNTEKTLDVTGAKVFLGTNLSKPYNNLRIVTTTLIDSTSSMVYFDSSDKITLTYGFPDFNIDYLLGYFGSETTRVSLGNIDLNELSDYTDNVKVNNPKIIISIANSIGIPSKLRFNLTTYSSSGESLKLNVDDQEIAYPDFVDRGNILNTIISIDTSNSNLVECLSLPANRINGDVEVVTNYNGKVYNNFIDKGSEIKIGYNIDVPMRFTMEPTSIMDTLILGDLGVDIIESEYIEVVARTINELPFDAGMSFKFADTGNVVIDSLENIDFIEAADVDVDGKVILTKETETVIRLTDAIAQKIKNKQISAIILKVNLNSGGIQDNTVVALNSRNKILTSLAFRFKK